MSWLRLFLRFTMALVFVLVVAGAGVILVPKYRHMRHLQRERDRLEREREQTETRIADLRQAQERFATDPEFVERVARQNRRIRPGETVFVLEAVPGGSND